MRNAKLVEDAACLCSAMASMYAICGLHEALNFSDVYLALGLNVDTAAKLLAVRVMNVVWRANVNDDRWALACSLLRNHEIPVGKGEVKPTAEDKAIAAEFRRICAKCGQPYALHGAASPHTRGEECSGFEPKKDRGVK